MFNHNRDTLHAQLQILQTDAGIAALIQQALNRNPAGSSRYLAGARLYLAGLVEAAPEGAAIASAHRPTRYTVQASDAGSGCTCTCLDYRFGSGRDAQGRRMCRHTVAYALHARFGPRQPIAAAAGDMAAANAQADAQTRAAMRQCRYDVYVVAARHARRTARKGSR